MRAATIAGEQAKRHRDLRGIDAHVLVCPSEGARPFPDIAEKAAMELAHEQIGKHVCLAAADKPGQAALDVGLLELIELATRRDVPESQVVELIGIEGRCPGRLQSSGGRSTGGRGRGGPRGTKARSCVPSR